MRVNVGPKAASALPEPVRSLAGCSRSVERAGAVRGGWRGRYLAGKVEERAVPDDMAVSKSRMATGSGGPAVQAVVLGAVRMSRQCC